MGSQYQTMVKQRFIQTVQTVQASRTVWHCREAQQAQAHTSASNNAQTPPKAA
jgi:hypothetical protein